MAASAARQSVQVVTTNAPKEVLAAITVGNIPHAKSNSTAPERAQRDSTRAQAPKEQSKPREYPPEMCTRCGGPNKFPCQCGKFPKCEKCGGLHRSDLHETAKKQYAARMGPNRTLHDLYDRKPEENEKWHDRDVRRINDMLKRSRYHK